MSNLFPRSFAMAERLWTDPPAGQEIDFSLWMSALQRLRVLNDYNMMNKCFDLSYVQPLQCLEDPEICNEFTSSFIPTYKYPDSEIEIY